MSEKEDWRDRFPWPSIDWRLSKQERLQRIAARDALFFTFAANILLTVAWIAATTAGFNCYAKQSFNDSNAMIGLWIMVAISVALCFRLTMSVFEHVNALLNDPMSQLNMGRRFLFVALSVPFVFVGAALIYVAGSAVLQSSEYCIKLERSPWAGEPEMGF